MSDKKDSEQAFLNPSSSIEASWLTVQPGYDDIQIPSDGFDDPGAVLNLLSRDFRLGRLVKKHHDIAWTADRLDVAMGLLLLRGGRFRVQAVAVLATAAAITETGLAVDGFLRRNQRSVHKSEESTFEDKGSRGGLSNLFGTKKNHGGMY